jgi:REP element-mobilizing transposase RayT
MSSRRAPWHKGEYYHIYNEGCDSRQIFMDEADYAFFTKRLLQYAEEFHLVLVAWCLMPNHYHLLVHQTDLATAGKVAQHACNSYSKYFNRRHGRRGTLFASSYKVKHARAGNYFIHLFRYIHANPVTAGIVDRPEEWKWSNFGDFCGKKRWNKLDERFRAGVPDPDEYRRLVDHHIERALKKTPAQRAAMFRPRRHFPPDGLLLAA